MKETQILGIGAGGWVSNPDPTTGASMGYFPNLENFSPTYEGALVLAEGYVPSGLAIDPMTGNAAIVCLLPFEQTNGKVCVVYGGGGELWIEEIVSVPEADDLAGGKVG